MASLSKGMIEKRGLRRRNKIRSKNGIFVVTGLILAIHMITLMLPFVWMLLTSVKGLLDYQNSFLGFPEEWHWENYTDIFDILKIERVSNGVMMQFDVVDMLINSFTLALFTPLFAVMTQTAITYVVAKYDFKGRNFLINLNLFVMIVPIIGSLATTLTVYKDLGIYNNLWAYIIFPGGCFGFNFLLLSGVFRSIPNSYAEAAQIDGAGHFAIFTRIMLPLAKPTLVTLYVLGFISHWNDYNSSLIYLPSVPNLAYGLYEFQYNASKYGAILPEILAAFTVCSLPSVILFCSSQKIITKSLMVGGLKG